MSDVTLYYPWIDPPKEETLKTAMLYWDEMRTIVPESIEEPYQTQATKAASDLGFLRRRNINPEMPEVETAGAEFLGDFERKAIQADGLNARDRANLHHEKLPSWLHGGKVADLMKYEVFGDQQPSADGFYNVAEGFGLAYMSRLASTICDVDQITPTTDRDESHDVIIDRFIDLEKENRIDRAEALLARLSIETIHMEPSTPLFRIKSFRDEHYDELVLYRRAVRKLAREVSGITNLDHLEREIKKIVKDEIRPAQEQVEGRMRDHQLDFGMSMTDVATSLGIEAAQQGKLQAILGPIVGSAVGLVCSLCRLRRPKTAKGPYSYLVRAKKRFGE